VPQELTYDYQYAVGESARQRGSPKALECRCGEDNCKKRLY